MDTVFITGKAPHGVLILPQPPVDKRYRIDSVTVDDYKVRLFQENTGLTGTAGLFISLLTL